MGLFFDLAAGFFAGVLASMGLGGGVVLMIYLRMVSNLSQLTAQGLNLAFFIPIGVTAAIIHLKNGLISKQAALLCIPTGILGAAAASLLAAKLSEQFLSNIFAFLLLWIGLREILAALK
ncbi:MAG: sulfite exporter TauE/SafE family protein [Oscillospiraceae bacterium]|nr:sulfite exporter TauE/SafE family protein [Oscillospiraceae bacterium]